MPDIKSLTKNNWNTSNPTPTMQDLQVSALMRIADASEKMAEKYTRMESDLEWYKKMYRERTDEADALRRRIASLKGVITKLKKR